MLSSFLDAAHSRGVSPFVKRMFDLVLAAALAVVKLEYDLYYIKHQSIGFDARILLRTAGTVLRLGGQ